MRSTPQVILLSLAVAAGAMLPVSQARAYPGSATLSWEPPTENVDGSYLEDLAGYRIYYGKSASRLDRTVEIDNPGLTRYVIEDLALTRWHFSMTTINAQGAESQRSPTVSKRVR